MKKILLLAIFSVSVFSIYAQKTAYIHRDSVFNRMPKMKEAQTELNDFLTQVQTEIQTMQDDYKEKVETFNKNVNTYSDVVKDNKVSEIKDLEKRIQDFQVKAQNEYLEKQKTLIVPIQKQFDDAVEKVRKRMKFDVVINIGPDVISVDPKYEITDEVMKELGIE